jgi:putative polyhydroxyalkanoate system protein
MEIQVKHQLNKDEVKKRLLNLADELKKKYGDQLKNYSEQWNGNKVDIAFKMMGFNINGILEILDDKVVMSGKVPMMLKAFQSQVEDAIYDTLNNLLKK